MLLTFINRRRFIFQFLSIFAKGQLTIYRSVSCFCLHETKRKNWMRFRISDVIYFMDKSLGLCILLIHSRIEISLIMLANICFSLMGTIFSNVQDKTFRSHFPLDISSIQQKLWSAYQILHYLTYTITQLCLTNPTIKYEIMGSYQSSLYGAVSSCYCEFHSKHSLKVKAEKFCFEIEHEQQTIWLQKAALW